MNKKTIVFLLLLTIATGINTYGANCSRAFKWLDGTWVGMKYQANVDKAWKVELKCDTKKGSYQINYSDLNCKGYLEFIRMKGKNAIFIEKMNSGLCLDDGYIIITFVNANLISFTCLRDDKTRLASYCTLEKLSESGS